MHAKFNLACVLRIRRKQVNCLIDLSCARHALSFMIPTEKKRTWE